MLGNELEGEHVHEENAAPTPETPHGGDRPAGKVRLLPLMTFGMRAAALSGLAVAVGGVLAAMGGNEGNTTCCGG